MEYDKLLRENATLVIVKIVKEICVVNYKK
jgi:hypothetical protein